MKSGKENCRWGTVVMLCLAAVATIRLPNCSKYDQVNPADPDYRGNYTLSVAGSTLPDSLLVFTRYRANYVAGKDDFQEIRARGCDDVAFDTEVFRGSLTEDSLTLYFGAVGSCELHVVGVHPNERQTVDTLTVRTVNGFAARIDSPVAAQEEMALRVARIDSTVPVEARGEHLVVWAWPDSTADTVAADSVLRHSFNARGAHVLRPTVLDHYGTAFALDTIPVRCLGFPPDSPSVRLGEGARVGARPRFTLRVRDVDDDSVRAAILFGTDTVVGPASVRADGVDTTLTARTKLTDTTTLTWRCMVTDSTGLSAGTGEHTSGVAHTPPTVRTAIARLQVPFGDTAHIAAIDSQGAAMHVRWSSQLLGDTTLSPTTPFAAVYPPTLADTLHDTITARGVDTYGFAGPRDTTYVLAREYDYVVALQGPAEVFAGRPAVWQATASSPRGLPLSTVSYAWACAGADTFTTHGDRLEAVWPVADHGLVSVFALVNGRDTTQTVFDPVCALPHAPNLIALTDSARRARLGDTVTCVVSATDVNPNGAIEAVVWREDAAQPQRLSAGDTTYAYVCRYPGTHTLRVWAEDDDSLLSDTAMFVVVVTADRPVVGEVSLPEIVYVNRAVTLRVRAYPRTGGADIAEYLWDFDGDTTVWDANTTEPSRRHTFADTGYTTVAVACVDGDGRRSLPAGVEAYVDPGTPRVTNITPDSAFVYDTVTLCVSAVDNEAVVGYGLSPDSGRTWLPRQADSVFVFVPAREGVHVLECYAMDNLDNRSAIYRDSLVVRAARPVVDSLVRVSPSGAVYAGDTIVFSAGAHDTNGTVAAFVPVLDDTVALDTIVPGTPAGTAGVSFTWESAVADTGEHDLVMRVLDDDRLSAEVSVSFTLRTGTPVVDSLVISSPSGALYAGDTLVFLAGAHDTNGTIAALVPVLDDTVALDTIVPGTPGGTAGVSFTWESAVAHAGEHDLVVRVLDNQGLTAESSVSFTVRRGHPVLDSVVLISPAETVYGGDQLVFVAGAHDTNGTIETFTIYLDGAVARSAPQSPSAANASDTLRVSLGAAASGVHTVAVVALDNHGLADTLDLEVSVVSGAPSIIGLAIDSAGGLFAGREVRLTIDASDPNGSIAGYALEWTGDGVNDWSATGPAADVVFAEGGDYDVRAVVADNDGLGDTLLTPVTVRRGLPVLDSLSPDNAWINESFTVYAHDTAGAIAMLYYDPDNNGTWDDSSSSGVFTFLKEDTAWSSVRVGARDGDGFTADRLFGVDVRAGYPSVRFAADTLYLPTRGATEDGSITWDDSIRIDVVSDDSHGSIVQYDWTVTWEKVGVSAAYHTDAGALTLYVPDSLVDTKASVEVSVTDDDGLVATASAALWADGPPPAAVIADLGSGLYSNTDQTTPVTVAWGGVDAIDSMETLFRAEATVVFPAGDSTAYRPHEDYMTAADSATVDESLTFGGIAEGGLRYEFTIPAYVIHPYYIGTHGYCPVGANAGGDAYGTVWLKDRHGRVSVAAGFRNIHGNHLCE